MEEDKYKIVAEAAFRQIEDHKSKAFQMQGEYGKWLISSLFLMHGSAIAGLVFKSASGVPVYLLAVYWFVAGLVLALGAGFSAWCNFTLAMNQYALWARPEMLVDLAKWPQPASGCAVSATMWIAIVCGVFSVVCLIAGSVHVVSVWHN